MPSELDATLRLLADASAELRQARTADEVRARVERAYEDVLAAGGEEAARAARPHLEAVAEVALEAVALREQLDSSLRAREALLASVSHDLRNPLNTFAMSAGLLRDDLERPEVDRARGLGLLGRMDRAIDRMQRLIEDLLEASRIEAKKIPLAPRVDDAAQLVRDAVAAAATLAREKRVQLEVDEVDPARVLVDRPRAHQLLSKVLGYAIKASSEGGTIRLSARAQGGAVRFAIQPASAQPPSSRSFAEEGRGGLALLIARGLAEAHGGSLGFEDGTVIAFTLPAAS